MESIKSFISVGRVARPHGIRGEVVVRHPPGASGVASASSLFIRDSSGRYHEIAIERKRQRDHASFLVKFADVNDRNMAEKLAGVELFQAEENLPEPKEDEFYLHQIIGMRVVSLDHRYLGQVTALLESGSGGAGHDNLVVRDEDGVEFMIPFVDELVLEVDPKSGIMVVDLPDGLVEATSTPVKKRGTRTILSRDPEQN